jgi:integrase/recombinase XerD
MQLDDAITALMEELRRRNLKLPTIAHYRDSLGQFTAQLRERGLTDVREVRREHLEAHQGHLFTKGYTPYTVAQHMQALRRLFEHLTDTGQLLCDPMEGIVALRVEQALPRRIVSEAEMKKLLGAPAENTRTGIRDRAVLELLYNTGMRLGELLDLEVADVDLELGLVRILEGKGRKGRVVPLGHTAHAWVKEYLDRVRPWWMKGKDHERRLFVGRTGTAFRMGNVHSMLRQQCRQAGVQYIYPHAIRHACATHMLRRGADIRAIQKLLGHGSVKTTQRYTRVVPEDLKATHTRTHPLEA